MLAATTVPLAARAQSWPSGPIRIIVPFSAGGSVDGIPRLLQNGLQERLGVPVIIENRPGASGTTGTALVAKATPDGNTWLSIADTLAVSPALIANLPFDTEKDLEPVLLIGTSPYVLAINPSRPYKTLADLIAAAKQTPDSISYASFGTGSGGHLAMVQLGKASGAPFVHVPYRGGGPAVADAIGGHVDLVIGSAALIAPLVQGNRLRGIVQMGPDRLPSLAAVPTIVEAGYPASQCVVWWGIFGTAGTPKPIIERFRAELTTGLRDERIARQLSETMHIKLSLTGPDEMRKFVGEQIRIWGAVVRENKIKADQ
jgi:tripartite-type tricarboxylate transporter receptor subunit TctC